MHAFIDAIGKLCSKRIRLEPWERFALGGDFWLKPVPFFAGTSLLPFAHFPNGNDVAGAIRPLAAVAARMRL